VETRGVLLNVGPPPEPPTRGGFEPGDGPT